jgi:prepilin-type N-terminal cleavage/methylation domain-containing protein
MDAKVEMASQKILTLTILNKRSQYGFSLVEILIVLGIFASLVAVGLPRFKLNTGNINSTGRELNAISRQIRQVARIKQGTYRLVFDLDAKPSEYWIEYTTQFFDLKKEQSEQKKTSQETQDSENPPLFSRDEQIFKKTKLFPPSVTITSIETLSSKEPQTSGLAFIYYWPTGIVDLALIRMKNDTDKELFFLIQPLTGRGEFSEKNISLRDVLIR